MNDWATGELVPTIDGDRYETSFAKITEKKGSTDSAR